MNESINLLVPLRELSKYFLECRSKAEEALELLILSTIIFIIFNVILFYLIHNFRNVTAHPDDECMFFGPTLIALKKNQNCRIFVLCMSKGDHEKLGNVRKDELWNACRCLDIQPQDITLTHCTNLPDDPNTEWKVELLSSLILNQVEALDIDLVITFDKDGVSQHKNHQALYYAVASLCLSGLMPSTCRILILETVNIIRKYLSFFDVLLSLLLSTNWSIMRLHERQLIKSAMCQHISQMVWFRKLYIIFSRYMIINSLTELNVESIEFDILES
ncbi:hypothetical protein PVAND_012597 [Polypedilum vanderplanki]|uniref:N-acetylglucosaminylphosphatidylinositol deacetylase n=1 Tax=Polypedilum vanderplanki TaxID=319348 RepID=A0A9J6CN70_POLVA|nr:hypothetical protein PVAND_012597 [Polypedilum vanderplanki]